MRSFISPLFYFMMVEVFSAIIDPSRKPFSRMALYSGALEQLPEEGRLKGPKNAIAPLS